MPSDRLAGRSHCPEWLNGPSPVTCLLPSTRWAHALAMDLRRSGSYPSPRAPAEQFTGTVRVDPLFQQGAPARTSGTNVTSEPLRPQRLAYASLGGTLIVMFGCGLTSAWTDRGDSSRRRRHGRAEREARARRGAEHGDDPHRDPESLDGKNVEWLEKVTEGQYTDRGSTQSAGSAP